MDDSLLSDQAVSNLLESEFRVFPISSVRQSRSVFLVSAARKHGIRRPAVWRPAAWGPAVRQPWIWVSSAAAGEPGDSGAVQFAAQPGLAVFHLRLPSVPDCDCFAGGDCHGAYR